MSNQSLLSPPVTVVVDVAQACGVQEGLVQTARVFVPREPTRARALLVCLPGGSYDWRYWHFDVEGHPGYSFAEHLAGRGYVVVAVSHLGVGDSATPPGSVGLSMLAAGDEAVVVHLKSALAAGTLTPDLPALRLPVVGVGHSMGACLTTMIASRSPVYDAVCLLGYGVQITHVYNDTNEGHDLQSRIGATMAAFRELNAVDDDAEHCYINRDLVRALFHAPDVPHAVVVADDHAASLVSVRAASEVTVPGFVERYACGVEVPIFLGFGEALDVSPDPFAEPASYRSSKDVTVFLVPGSHHCHNFAQHRTLLWDRIAAWITTVVG
jgi:pimeloyl-ACP methyl ester carboxylesterase